MTSAIFAKTDQYFSGTLARHGPSAKGVDWKDDRMQSLAFAQLARLLPAEGEFSLADLGCGYGAFFDYVAERFDGLRYLGIDLSASMIASARSRISDPRAGFQLGHRIEEPVDYAVAAGIFNAHLGTPEAEWEAFIHGCLDNMHAMTRRGFAFNLFSTYVDFRKETLYYADPLRYFDHCVRRYSRHVALLHDYPLYEFTILVRKYDQGQGG